MTSVSQFVVSHATHPLYVVSSVADGDAQFGIAGEVAGASSAASAGVLASDAVHDAAHVPLWHDASVPSAVWQPEGAAV